MIIGRDLLGELGIIMNFNDRMVTWDTDTITMKDRDSCNEHTITWDADTIPMNDRDTAFYHQ
jgi:hypothetical protein